ncbi:recombination-associated protein RdgC [Stenotrophomonas maltophilia]|uniref:recombination-associated protein RdgC n=1 Tax=Stenotrophomonas maltophilia TaxID=40324 RepID=UPI0015DDE01D|nr:recombination-associated protein RdgC [Stenotrophomonas maltophilia]MBA0428566.1 recombination-associated protein RdgC [Stenotrophomonas maltophilia]MCU1145754.1 recombination-associated protein RdgC [Stenotrophomonas maltophilia]
MFFRNLTMFRAPQITMFELQDGLEASALKPVGPLEYNSAGFVSPFGRGDGEPLSHEVAGALWLTIGEEEKILPAAVIAQMLERKLAEIEESEGRRPGGRERKRIKDDLLHELLPKAFVTYRRNDMYLDHARGVVFVDTSSRKTGENMMSAIRGALGSFPAMPVNAEVSPRAVLTGWIAGEPLPEGMSLGEEAELRDPVQGGAVVKCNNQELRCDEIDKHLDAGKQVTKLGLVFRDRLSFLLGEDLTVRKLRFLEGAVDQLDVTDMDSRRAEIDARFVLQVGEVGALFDALEQAFRLTRYV